MLRKERLSRGRAANTDVEIQGAPCHGLRIAHSAGPSRGFRTFGPVATDHSLWKTQEGGKSQSMISVVFS